jgi:hypothetical protein
MTHEPIEVVEIGQAEALIEIGMIMGNEEVWEKFESGAAPYVEFE